MPDDTPRPAVLFDIDGTLVDSNYVHVHTWARAFREVDSPVDSWRIHRSIGMDGSLLVDRLLGDPNPGVAERAKDLHSKYYQESSEMLHVLGGTRELLAGIADLGLQVVLATSAPEDELALLREVLGVDEIVSTVTSSEDVDTAKPQPDIVQVALNRAGVAADRAVMVGDTVWDGKASTSAEVPFVAVRSGGVSRAELEEAGASVVYDGPGDLLANLDDSPIGALARQVHAGAAD